MDEALRTTRRALLGTAATLLASVTGLSSSATAAEPTIDLDPRRVPDPASGESLALARHVALTRYADLPATAVQMCARSILDALGVSMAASGQEPACRPFLAQALEEGRGGDAVVLGTGRRTTPSLAALANGALAHALDFEDAHDPSRTHPTAAPVAAAVALASSRAGLSGREFLLAVALGSDVTCRISMAQGNVSELPRAFYPPAIAGTMGATATASRLLGLTPEQTLDAFSLALCQNACSAEILSDAYSDLRAVRDGFSAQVAVQAAQLARRGVKGFSRPFEGERGLYAMYAGGRHIPGKLTEALGQRYEGQYVGFKAWPACRDTHPYIQAVLEGMARDRLDPSQIETIHATVPPASLIVCEPAAEKRRPRAAIDAKFSLYYTIASTVLRRAVTFASYTPEALRTPEVLALADRVAYSVGKPAPLIRVHLRDGSVKDWHIDALYGSPGRPMSEAALVEKFIDCGRAALKPRSGQQLAKRAQQILALHDVSDMRPLLRSL